MIQLEISLWYLISRLTNLRGVTIVRVERGVVAAAPAERLVLQRLLKVMMQETCHEGYRHTAGHGFI